LSTLVLIGGTGSLGSAILKHQELLKEKGVSRLRIISRDEQKQEHLERHYQGEIELQCFLGDVRNEERMHFALEKADYVIHMAALKMIDRFELDIEEGYETNINGTRNVMRAALEAKTLKSAIFVSTDKACKPINAYGISKLAAERIWLWANSFQKQTKFGVCLYGNVYGSRGSVVELWNKQKNQGELSVPLTDERMTRFFILKRDASRFVLDSLFNNQSKVMIPEMKATKMTELLKAMDLKWHKIPIRPGEKLHEDIKTKEIEINSESAPHYTLEELREMNEAYLDGE